MTTPTADTLLDLLQEVGRSGVDLDDSRVSYITVQIDRGVWAEIQEAAKSNACGCGHSKRSHDHGTGHCRRPADPSGTRPYSFGRFHLCGCEKYQDA